MCFIVALSTSAWVFETESEEVGGRQMRRWMSVNSANWLEVVEMASAVLHVSVNDA